MAGLLIRCHGAAGAAISDGALPSPAPGISALGEATIASDRELVTVSWREVEENPARLWAAVELLRTLISAPRGGAYR